MTKHTAGPWAYHFEPTINRHVVRAGFAGERNICIDYGAGLKSYEAAANARLIAAAPDMIELLRDCSDFLDRSDDDLEAAERLSQRIKALCASIEGG
jgi:hypothetical protein